MATGTGDSLSFRDPHNLFVRVGGGAFRLLSPSAADTLRRFERSSIGSRLVSEGHVVGWRWSSESESRNVRDACAAQLPGRDVSLHVAVQVDEHPLISYPWEWPTPLLREAALHTLRVRGDLLREGFDLQDASPVNVQFASPAAPCLIDLGSIVDYEPHPLGWAALRQFVDELLNPLLLAESLGIDSSQTVSLFGSGGANATNIRPLLGIRRRSSPSLLFFHGATNPRRGGGQIGALRGTGRVEAGQAVRVARSQLERLERLVSSIEAGGALGTEWENYAERSHYSSDDLRRKIALAREFVGSGRAAGTVVDLGGNDGLVATALSVDGVRAVTVDPDRGAVARSAARAIAEGAAGSPMSLVGDLRTVDESLGLLGREYPSLASRLAPSVVLLHSVIHHLSITQAIPFDLVVRALRSVAPRAQIEFPLPTDEKVVHLLGRVNRWSGDYSLEAFIAAATRHYGSVEVQGHTSPTRVMIACREGVVG